jgi:hypothetical protein
MGNSTCSIRNNSARKISVLTFNEADLLYQEYADCYIINVGETIDVEAMSNPIGLKVAIVFSANTKTQEVRYKRWKCANDSTFSISYMNGHDIYASGDNVSAEAVGKITIYDEQDFSNIVAALQYIAPNTLIRNNYES